MVLIIYTTYTTSHIFLRLTFLILNFFCFRSKTRGEGREGTDTYQFPPASCFEVRLPRGLPIMLCSSLLNILQVAFSTTGTVVKDSHLYILTGNHYNGPLETSNTEIKMINVMDSLQDPL